MTKRGTLPGPGTPTLFEFEAPTPKPTPQRGRKPRVPRVIPPTVTNLTVNALRLREELQEHGRLTRHQARSLFPKDWERALQELELAGWAQFLPGGDGTRTGRAAAWISMTPPTPPTELELSFARGKLAGQSGTLSRFGQLLGFDQRGTLAVLQGLVTRGEATGGVVGATFAFRVFVP